MRIIVRTIYGSALQTARHLGIQHDIPPFASVNETLSDPLVVPYQPAVQNRGMEIVSAYDAASDTDSLRVQYFCIGNNGHQPVTGAGNVTYMAPVPHKASDSGLFHMIPFLVQPFTQDVSAGFLADRPKYRLRKTLWINDILYVAYFGRVIDLSSVVVESSLEVVTGGGTTSVPFIPNQLNLRPARPPVDSVNDGTYLAASSSVTVTLDETETQAIRDACQLLYGDSNLAIISEIGLMSGADKAATARYNSDATGQDALPADTYFETVGSQIVTHISTYYSAVNNNTINFTLDMGATEPLFGTNMA
jgi:hypothetical protein